MVPGEHSTGGKQQLTGTSRRGNKYLRKLFVLGAHTVLLQRRKQSSGLSTWLASLVSRKRKQVATVAVANKMARMVWAVLCKGEAYRPHSYHKSTQLEWPAYDAWHKRQAWKSLQRFPHLQANDDDGSKFSDSCQVCWRTMRWHNGRSRRSRNLYPENAFQGSETKKDEGAAHSIRAGVRYSNKGRIHSRRPILSSSFFACNTAADHTVRVAGYTAIAKDTNHRNSSMSDLLCCRRVTIGLQLMPRDNARFHAP